MDLPDIVHIHFEPTLDGLNVVDDLSSILTWLPVLGPSASWLLYLTAAWANEHRTYEYPTGALATALGLGPRALAKTFERLVMFRVAVWAGTDTLVIGSPLPALSATQSDRLAYRMATQ